MAGIPILIHLPAFCDRDGDHVAAAARRARERHRQQHHGGDQAPGAGLFIAVGATHLHPENYRPFAPNGFTGIHQGAAIVFFAYIGFDAISTAAEETKNPQRNLPIGILGGLAICTLIYVIVGFVLTGMVPLQGARGRRSAGARARARRFQARSAGSSALGAAVSMSAVLLVFQYGQPRIFFAMARDGLLPQWAAKIHPRTQHSRGRRRSSRASSWRVWSLVGDAGETYDLTNIGTLFAFMLVSIGVLVLRYTEPNRPRPFRVPFVWPVCLLLGGRLRVHHVRPAQDRHGSGSGSGW